MQQRSAERAPSGLADGSARRLTAAAAVLAAILVAIQAGLAVRAPTNMLVNSVADDSGYYLVIADRLVTDGDLSFDGIDPTNGFQPLWLVALTPLSGLRNAAGLSADTYLRLAVLLQLALIALSSIILWLGLRSAISPEGAAVGLLTLAALGTTFGTNGMDTGVLLLSLSLSVLLYLRWVPATRQSVLLGLALGAVALSRLDVGLYTLAAACGAALIASIRMRSRWFLIRVWTVPAVGVATVVPYLALNTLAFGHPVPISGRLKSTFPEISFSIERLPLSISEILGIALALSFAVLFLAKWGTSKRLPSRVQQAAFIGCAVILLQVAYTVLWFRWGVFQYHFHGWFVADGLIVAAVFSDIRTLLPADRLRVLLTASTLAGASLVAIALQLVLWPTSSGLHAQFVSAANWARTSTSTEDVFAMTDAGLFGLYSGRSTINLDGVASGEGLQEAIKTGELSRFMSDRFVTFVVVPHAGRAVERDLYPGSFDGWRVTNSAASAGYGCTQLIVRSHLFDASDTIELCETEEEYRSPTFRAEGFDTAVVAWSR